MIRFDKRLRQKKRKEKTRLLGMFIAIFLRYNGKGRTCKLAFRTTVPPPGVTLFCPRDSFKTLGLKLDIDEASIRENPLLYERYTSMSGSYIYVSYVYIVLT